MVNTLAFKAFVECAPGTTLAPHVEVSTAHRETRGQIADYDDIGVLLKSAYLSLIRPQALGDVFIPWATIERIRVVLPPAVESEA